MKTERSDFGKTKVLSPTESDVKIEQVIYFKYKNMLHNCNSLYFLLCFLFVFAMFWRFSCYLSSRVIVVMFIWYEIEHSPKVLSAPFGYFQACMVSSWIWLHFSFATFPLLSHLHNH